MQTTRIAGDLPSLRGSQLWGASAGRLCHAAIDVSSHSMRPWAVADTHDFEADRCRA